MTHERLSDSGNWELENPDQDVRGWPIVDDRGRSMGRVDDLLVDTTTQTVDTLVTDAGQEIPASQVSLANGEVHVRSGFGTGASRLAEAATGSSTDSFEGSSTGLAEPATDRAGSLDRDDTWRISRSEERLEATRHPEQVGDVSIYRDVVEDVETTDVPVTRDRVEVRRTVVDRDPTDAERAFGSTGDTMSVPIVEEEVDVTKRPRVVEEVEISKRPVTETQRVSGTVRRERVSVEGDDDLERSDPRRDEDVLR